MSRKLIRAALVAPFFLGALALFYRMMDSTVYSPGYSERAFKEIRDGMTKAEVERLVGAPLRIHNGDPGVTRWYGPPGSSVMANGGLVCPTPDWSNLAIIEFDPTGEFTMQNPWKGKTPDEIAAVLGKPIKEHIHSATVYWVYTQSDGNYHRRWVGFDQSKKVVETVAYYWWD